MSLYSKIKGLAYEMEEYLYELKEISPETKPQRVDFLVKEYKKDLKTIIKLTEEYLMGVNGSKKISKKQEEEKKEVSEIQNKHSSIIENLEKMKKGGKKPKTQKAKLKIEMASQEKVYKHPELLHELICALMGEDFEESDYVVSDESTVKDFAYDIKSLKALSKFEKKYNLKKLKFNDYLWIIVENMYKFRPF